jgi:hypothetical protein
MNLKKWDFLIDKVLFIGFVISVKDVHVDEENVKTKTIREWLTRNNISELYSFYDLTIFYKHFIPNFSHIVALIT